MPAASSAQPAPRARLDDDDDGDLLSMLLWWVHVHACAYVAESANGSPLPRGAVLGVAPARFCVGSAGRNTKKKVIESTVPGVGNTRDWGVFKRDRLGRAPTGW